MALNAPGPVAAAHLRDAGAQVTKVEPPGGDPLAAFSPGWYGELHAAVTVARLDLKTTAGAASMRSLLADADLFLSSQRPSALQRLALDPASLAGDERTRHVRTLNIVGELDRPEVAGHDLTYLAQAGLLGREMPRALVADILGAERTFATALQLLRQPPGTGAQVGLFDSLRPLAAALRHGLTAPRALLGGGLPAYGVYDALEGRVAIAALEPHFQERLYRLLELPFGSDLTAAMRRRPAHEWQAWGVAHDVPIAACRD